MRRNVLGDDVYLGPETEAEAANAAPPSGGIMYPGDPSTYEGPVSQQAAAASAKPSGVTYASDGTEVAAPLPAPPPAPAPPPRQVTEQQAPLYRSVVRAEPKRASSSAPKPKASSTSPWLYAGIGAGVLGLATLILAEAFGGGRKRKK